MPEFGMIGVDWEERVDFDRMRRERLQRARVAMEEADVDVLFVFAMEDVRYLTAPVRGLGRVGTASVVRLDVPQARSLWKAITAGTLPDWERGHELVELAGHESVS